MKYFVFILALCVLAIALPIDPRIPVLLILGVASAGVAVKLGKTAGILVGITLFAALSYALNS
jgi:hypothetical protein